MTFYWSPNYGDTLKFCFSRQFSKKQTWKRLRGLPGALHPPLLPVKTLNDVLMMIDEDDEDDYPIEIE